MLLPNEWLPKRRGRRRSLENSWMGKWVEWFVEWNESRKNKVGDGLGVCQIGHNVEKETGTRSGRGMRMGLWQGSDEDGYHDLFGDGEGKLRLGT
jgi:hypothetical protein